MVDLPPLAGFTIAVTADRRAEEQISLLTNRGAECVHAPTIKTDPIGSTEPLVAATEELIGAVPDIVVFTTGIGVRGWLEAAESGGVGGRLRATLERSENWARGPKAKGALVTAGHDVAWVTPNARYDDIVDQLERRADVSRLTIGVQLDGAGAAWLVASLRSLGAQVVEIPVYRWSLPAARGPVERLIQAIVERRVDGVTFTAKPQVENLFEIAGLAGSSDDLEAALADIDVFCVGEVCATGFDEVPAVLPIVPERHRLGAMVQSIARHYERRSTRLELGGVPVVVQGRLVGLGGDTVALTDRERALLAALASKPGAVLSKKQLLQRVWQGAESDEHLVEVTVGRLRQRLGPAAAGIQTIVRRGYRLSVD